MILVHISTVKITIKTTSSSSSCRDRMVLSLLAILESMDMTTQLVMMVMMTSHSNGGQVTNQTNNRLEYPFNSRLMDGCWTVTLPDWICCGQYKETAWTILVQDDRPLLPLCHVWILSWSCYCSVNIVMQQHFGPASINFPHPQQISAIGRRLPSNLLHSSPDQSLLTQFTAAQLFFNLLEIKDVCAIARQMLKGTI